MIPFMGPVWGGMWERGFRAENMTWSLSKRGSDSRIRVVCGQRAQFSSNFLP